jgi:hypothetical protein
MNDEEGGILFYTTLCVEAIERGIVHLGFNNPALFTNFGFYARLWALLKPSQKLNLEAENPKYLAAQEKRSFLLKFMNNAGNQSPIATPKRASKRAVRIFFALSIEPLAKGLSDEIASSLRSSQQQ